MTKFAFDYERFKRATKSLKSLKAKVFAKKNKKKHENFKF